MKNQIATTIKQSHRLLVCGVDPKTADMSVRTIKEPYGEDMAWHIPKLLTLPYDEARTIYGDDEITPAWSLSALLEQIPHSILSQYGKEYFFELSRLRMHDQWEAQWIIGGERFKTFNKADKTFCKLWDKSPIEVCVKAVEFLTTNGYSLNKTEK